MNIEDICGNQQGLSQQFKKGMLEEFFTRKVPKFDSHSLQLESISEV